MWPHKILKGTTKFPVFVVCRDIYSKFLEELEQLAHLGKKEIKKKILRTEVLTIDKT